MRTTGPPPISFPTIMVSKDKVKALLSDGFSSDIVASACGCTPAYISQLLADEDFKKEVEDLKSVKTIKNVETDKRYDELEDKLLTQFENQIAIFRKPRDLLAGLKFVNEAKRKSGAGAGPGKDLPASVVNLRLPAIIMQQNNYKVNIHGTMVEVGDRDLTPMPSSELLKTLEERRESEARPKLPEKIAEPVFPNERIAHESKV
jgi:hypothetical protein